MDRSHVLTLIAKTYATDGIGQRIHSETERKAYCDVSSVSQSEFFEAGRAGLKPAFQVTMFASDYHGETECVLNSIRYSIYRTYRRKDDDIELYLEKRVGS